MEIRTITHEMHDEFVLNSPYTHYMKTSMWANVKNDKASYIGFYLNEEIIGSAMILKEHYGTAHYLYIPSGMIIDYTNEEILADCLELLISYASKENAAFLRIDPNVLRCHRDISGNKIDDGFDNENITELFKKKGFIHKGYNGAYDGSYINRYTLIIDIKSDMETIKKHFNKAKITSLNRHKVIGVSTHIGTKEDLPYLSEYEKQLCAIQGFKPKPIEYFESIMDAFKEYARLYVTTIDLDQMIAGTETEISSKKYSKDPEAKAAKEKELEKAKVLKEKYGSSLPIATGLFLYYGEKSWDLYTYNHKDFNFIKPVDNLHTYAIEDMKNHGVMYYDMCGFSGNTSKDDPYYGLYAYKKSFGSQFTEYIGEFDYVYDKTNYSLFKKEKALSYKLRHFYNMHHYKKD